VFVNDATPNTAYNDYGQKEAAVENQDAEAEAEDGGEVVYDENDCLMLHPFNCPTYPKAPLVREHNIPYLE